MKVVNDERTRLVEVIAHPQREAARWEHAAGLLAAQSEAHAGEEASARAALAKTEAHLTAVRDDAVRPLLDRATVDGQAYLDTQSQQDAAWDATRSTGRLGRRADWAGGPPSGGSTRHKRRPTTPKRRHWGAGAACPPPGGGPPRLGTG